MNLGDIDDSVSDCIARAVPRFSDLPPPIIAEISKFNWLWPCFEALRCNKKANQNSLDGFATNPCALALFGEAHYDEAAQFCVDRYTNEPRRLDDLAPRPDYEGDYDVIAIGLGDEASQENCSKALCRVVYRLRNNLFHGTKGMAGLNDQQDNFMNANTLLMHWINS